MFNYTEFYDYSFTAVSSLTTMNGKLERIYASEVISL
jgi:hypothetical protein